MELKQELEKAAERLRNDLSTLRAGRASAALIESLEVESYGAKMPLKALGSISSPGPRMLVIQPWDKNMVQPIEKAIRNSSLGFAPAVDRDVIRISIPPLTEERRKEMLKFLGRHAEDARIRVRQIREEAFKEIDRKEKSGEMSEDEKFRQKSDAQKIIDDANKRIEEITAAKEKEITTV